MSIDDKTLGVPSHRFPKSAARIVITPMNIQANRNAFLMISIQMKYFLNRNSDR